VKALSKKKEQGTEAPDGLLAPADAGAPLVRHFPEGEFSPDEGTVLKERGWTPAARAAALEARLAKHAAAGVAPAQAHAAAQQHVATAIQRGLQPPALVTHSHIHGHAVGHASHGVVHKHAHSHVKGAPHPHPASHHHPHAVKVKKMREAFSWTMPFKSKLQAGKRLIQGAAITVGKTLNKVPYTRDELLRSARTLAKKPLYINHLEAVDLSDPQDPRYPGAKQYLALKGEQLSALVRKAIEGIVQRNDPTVGFVRDSEYEDKEQAVEYIAEVTDPATQALVKAGEALGVSIGAVPRNPGEDKPVGIMFEDLSIITAPETPGDPDATVKMMEKLMEMVREPEEIHGRADAHLKMNKPKVEGLNCETCGAGNIWGLFSDKTKQCLACGKVTLLNILMEMRERVLREQLHRVVLHADMRPSHS
jgi:hypothetical protein